MTEIFFYHGCEDRIATAAMLVARASAQGKPMLVYAPDRAVAEAFDRTLWTQNPTSFVPHVLRTSPLAAETPVVITDQIETLPHDERLVNLSDTLPPGFARFQRLLEVISQEADCRTAGRERYRFYKDHGYPLHATDCSHRS